MAEGRRIIKEEPIEEKPQPLSERADDGLDFDDTAINVHNKIRGLSPVPGGYSMLDGKRVKFYRSRVVEDNSNNPSGLIYKVDKTGLYVKTKENAVAIEELKVEGKKQLPIKDLLNGMKPEELLNKSHRKE